MDASAHPRTLPVRTRLILLTAALTLAGLLLAAVFVERQNTAAHRLQQRNQVRESLSLLQSRLEGNLRSNILLVRGLVSVIAADPDIDQPRFERAARPLFEGQSQLRNIGAAPGMVIRLMYPLTGNEKAVGLDYRKIPAQFEAAERARVTRELVLAGPLELAQSGIGLVGRMPVFIDDAQGVPRFWGLISAVIDGERLYRDSGLLDADLPIEVALRGKDARGEFGEVFFGAAVLFSGAAVGLTIPLPYGSWQMAARPKGGWSSRPDNTGTIRLAFTLIALLILSPMLLLAHFDLRQRRAEQRLAASEERLSLAANAGSRAKSEFLATMSHEIRTPMNGVLGMAELLQTTPLNDEQQGYLATLQDSGRALLAILNDILDYSKIEAGRLTLEVVDFDLAALAGEVRDLLRPRAVEKGLLLELACPGDLPACLRGDAYRIRQVLVNLVGNAIKFTRVGRVDIEIVWHRTDAGAACVRLAVRDTGIGIAPAAQARLFSEFSQVDGSITRRFGGTGLGLTIAKRLVDAMQGRIGVVSAPDAGACFWFELTLPAGTGRAASRHGENAAACAASASLPVLDSGVLDALAKATGLDAKELLAMLRDDIAAMAAELEVAVAARDEAEMRRLTHSIKSSCAQLGAHKLSVLARDLEYALRESRVDDCIGGLPRFRTALGELGTAIGGLLAA